MSGDESLRQTSTLEQAGTIRQATLAEFTPLPEADAQYPLEYMDANSVIKLREDDAEVIVGVCDPLDSVLLRSLRDFHGKPVSFLQIEKAELAVGQGRTFTQQQVVEQSREWFQSPGQSRP